MKYGFYDTQSFADFMVAYTQMQREERDSGDLHPTASMKPWRQFTVAILRKHALKGRAILKEARRLNKPLSDGYKKLFEDA